MSHSLGMFIILILILIQVGLLGINFISYYFRSPGTYFAVPVNGDVFRLRPISRPNVSTKALLNWATIAVTASLTLDFLNYKKNLEDLKQYFTEIGYDNFIQALDSQGVIDTIVSKKLVLTAVPIGPAIIIEEDDQRGIHSWRIQVPVTISYLSASAEEKRYKLVTILVSQVPTQFSARGIGIVQYEAIDVGTDVIRELL